MSASQQIYKQQQNQIAYKATAERRYFSGVQDDSQEKGELFGVKNIFRLRCDALKFLMDQSTDPSHSDESVRQALGAFCALLTLACAASRQAVSCLSPCY